MSDFFRSFKPGTKEVMALQADYVDSGLNAFVGQLIDEYSNIGWTMDIPVSGFVVDLICLLTFLLQCGYACSDHASWNEEGYPTSFPYEAVTGNDNPQVHTQNDNTNVNGFSWSHSLEFTKVGLAFVYEMAIGVVVR